MLNATVELFMTEYFLVKAVLGKYLDGGEELFSSLSRVFLIPEEDVERLYALSENDVAKSIITDKEFRQHQRMLKYSRMIGSEIKSDAEWEEVARIKGNAILTAQNFNLVSDADAPATTVYSCLSTAATNGLVTALRITGILQCEGIFLGKNVKAGIRNLTKAASWNDAVGTLALLYYQKENRRFNMTRLKQEVADTPFEQIYEAAAESYGEADTIKIGEVKLLGKAFSSGVLKRDVYDPKYARILGSKALYFKDKEKIFFAQSKELVGGIADLPLKLSHETAAPVDVGALKNAALQREEAEAVIRALNNGDLRGLPSYRPLCLCCDSRYVLNMYANAIAAKSADTHSEIIDVAELNDYDFEPTPNNIFIRSIDEDRDNRILLYFSGEISERKMEAVRTILQSGRRAKFHLNSPNVTLNLSAVLPVCLCDGHNAGLLEPYCDVIRLAQVTADEMPAALRDIVAETVKVYGIEDIKFDGEVAEIFDGYDIDSVRDMVDAAVRARREKGAVITLTKEVLKEYSSGEKLPVIGFGGSTNDKHQRHN